MFVKAQKKRAKLRLALAGPAGSGKTWGALKIAQGLGGRIAVIDTERGSASLYADLVDFDTLELAPPFHPEKFIDAIHGAEKAGYNVIVLDSITHEWDGAGGCLEINEKIAHAKFRGNTWAAWNETTPRHRAFVDAILQSSAHVIATMRSKTETVQGDDKKVKKIGMKAVQREGMEYEYAVVFELEHEKHWAVATKDRTRLFGEPHQITEDTGKRLLKWLDSGAELAPVEHVAPETTTVSPYPTDPVDPAIMDANIVRLSEFAQNENDAAIRELWDALKTDKENCTAVWKAMQKLYPTEFKYIKGVLAPKQENVA